ncbi:MAG: response regulator [Acidimicrobiia bacterium]|nr:response regulator [Acidimicrobiia bacterium]
MRSSATSPGSSGNRTSCSISSTTRPAETRRYAPVVTTRVVIAEDEAIIRLDLKETLEEEGYEVVGETGRGDEAVRLVRALRPDIAVLDVKMPGVDGLTAARDITAERLCAVLILTAFSQRELVEQARDAGALAYLVKPFQRSELVPGIELAIGRFREMQALVDHNLELAEQLETRKVVDRAKGLLMDRHGLSEADAYSFVQRRAMSDRTTMRAVAEGLLDGSIEVDVPGRAAP